jgi:hypothetical protein
MTDKKITTIGRCYGCKRTFAFDPENVTTFSIDPDTGLPPGMTALGTTREPAPEALARAVDAPVCPDCVSMAKRISEPGDPAAGRDPWPGEVQPGSRQRLSGWVRRSRSQDLLRPPQTGARPRRP